MWSASSQVYVTSVTSGLSAWAAGADKACSVYDSWPAGIAAAGLVSEFTNPKIRPVLSFTAGQSQILQNTARHCRTRLDMDRPSL
ncbi:hypothetical protein DSM101010T_08550 [Desulfovibrio subterraneus]|uniref:Uncharacterized protein n=1 Tax=Desulfovibrio subterraneus TaxID=2718620 RepID=A0A7J0BFN0_9BACT|nr:hypothetical protein DSM101010T_08550 [Desulfovibrio subterraneus]